MDLIDGSAIAAKRPHKEFQDLADSGYRFWYFREGEKNLIVQVHSSDTSVCHATFTDEGAYAFCDNIEVDKNHRRRQIGSATYSFAEGIFGKALTDVWANDSRQSKDAKALWANPKRIFGK